MQKFKSSVWKKIEKKISNKIKIFLLFYTSPWTQKLRGRKEASNYVRQNLNGEDRGNLFGLGDQFIYPFYIVNSIIFILKFLSTEKVWDVFIIV